MATFIAELREQPNSKGLHPVRIRIIVNRIPKRASLEFSIKASQWDSKKQRVKDNHLSSALYNQIIRDKIDQAERYYLTHPFATSDEIRSLLERSKPTDGILLSQALLDTANEHSNQRTGAYYRTTANMVTQCLGEISLESLGTGGLKKYEKWLRDKGLKQNTIHRHLKSIRTVIRKAVREKLLPVDKNPFLYYSIKSEQTVKQKLSDKELHLLENAKLESWEDLARDVFMFCFYTGGTRIGDALLLNKKNVVDGRLVYRMGKTGKFKNVKLSDKAQKIWNKYKGFPIVGEIKSVRTIDVGIAMVNKYLKKVAKRLGIETHLTTHIARHTFADMARKKTKDIYAIQQALGHSSMKVTEGYLRSLDINTSDDLIDSVQ